MKKLLIVLLMVAGFFVAVASVNAMPIIEVEGYVNPYVSTPTVDIDGKMSFAQIDYFFNVKTADEGAEMYWLKLEFTDEVFASVGSISGLNPGDWSPSDGTSTSGSFYQIASAGTTLGAGERLSFSMLDVVLNPGVLNMPSLWQEDHVWSQSWDARGINDRQELATDGGSTSPIPEPGTLMLLGSGLAGVGFYTRRRKK